MDFPAHSVDDYRYFVGDTIIYQAKRALPQNHLDEETIAKCINISRQYYSESWINNTRPYPGIPELLSELEKRGIPMAVLSNKPDEFVHIMVETLLPDFSFHAVRGALDSTPPKPDPAAALGIAAELSISPERFLYLGDTNTDMQTANAAGMYAIGVPWGFRPREELLQSGAKILIEEPGELLRLLD